MLCTFKITRLLPRTWDKVPGWVLALAVGVYAALLGAWRCDSVLIVYLHTRPFPLMCKQEMEIDTGVLREKGE